MRLTRFQADKRLWIGLSLILFVISCWLPLVPPNFEYDFVSPARLLRGMLDYNQYIQHLTSVFDERECNWKDYLRSTFFFFPPVVLSLLFGWVFQCIVV